MSDGPTIGVFGFPRSPLLFARIAVSWLWLIVVLVGLSVLLLSASWDLIAGHGWQIGGMQILGMFAGTELVVLGLAVAALSGVLPHRKRQPIFLGLSSPRLTLAMVILLAGPGVGFLLSAEPLLNWSQWALLGSVIAFALLMPRPLGTIFLVLYLFASLLLTAISTVKSDLTGLPVTSFDVRMMIAHPTSVWSSLGIPLWAGHGTFAAIAISALGAVWHALRMLNLQIQRGYHHQWLQMATGRTLLLVGYGFLFGHQLSMMADQITGDPNSWEADQVSDLSFRVGALPFLAYSFHAESRKSGDYFADSGNESPPAHDEVVDTVNRLISFPPQNERILLPNILVLMAESTFDPSHAFRLSQDIESPLFTPNSDTVAAGPMRVNAIGGGSWITEFETLVGLDAKLFGYAGSYTHSSLSPYVSDSIAEHLKRKGYLGWVFIPHPGRWFNYRMAYENYGFERILDSNDLEMPNWKSVDPDYVERAIRRLGDNPRGPFFAKVLLLENHGPHPCNPTHRTEIQTRFVGVDDQDAHCGLAEFLRRLKSTSAAMAIAHEYLQDLERRTNRPYVLLVYGDHQPYSFTHSHGRPDAYDLEPARRPGTEDLTFFHLMSSMDLDLDLGETVISAALLPTLLSSFVARGADEMYLPINLWLSEKCGPDGSDGGVMSLTQHAAREHSAVKRSQRCAEAYVQALIAYRESGTMGLIHSGNL
jgi:hypothetical protein